MCECFQDFEADSPFLSHLRTNILLSDIITRAIALKCARKNSTKVLGSQSATGVIANRPVHIHVCLDKQNFSA